MFKTLLAAVLLVGGLAACGSAPNDERPTVIAAFYPFAWIAEEIGGDAVNVKNLTKPGAEPHDIELHPRQFAEVQEADLIIFEEGFQPAVDDAVAQSGNDQVLDVAKIFTLADAEDDHGHSDHDHADHDPHVWLDPTIMITIAKAVEKHLADEFPEEAATFSENAAQLVNALTTLDQDFASGLKTCTTRAIVTSHAAFHYLTERYDLTQVAIAGVDPSNEPTPAQLAEITKLVTERGITTIFTEELVSPAIAKTVATETGAQIATLDPIEGLSKQTAEEDYMSLMYKNLAALKRANSCD